MLIGGDIYKNRDKRLPDAPGRVCYEADFNLRVVIEMTAVCCIIVMGWRL